MVSDSNETVFCASGTNKRHNNAVGLLDSTRLECHDAKKILPPLCRSGGSLREALNASPSLSFRWRTTALRLSRRRHPAPACGSIPVTSASPCQPPHPCTLPAGSSTWCTTTRPRRGEENRPCGSLPQPSEVQYLGPLHSAAANLFYCVFFHFIV